MRNKCNVLPTSASSNIVLGRKCVMKINKDFNLILVLVVEYIRVGGCRIIIKESVGLGFSVCHLLAG